MAVWVAATIGSALDVTHNAATSGLSATSVQGAIDSLKSLLDTHTHPASALASGTVDLARLPVGTTASTVARGDHAHAGGGGGPRIETGTLSLAGTDRVEWMGTEVGVSFAQAYTAPPRVVCGGRGTAVLSVSTTGFTAQVADVALGKVVSRTVVTGLPVSATPPAGLAFDGTSYWTLGGGSYYRIDPTTGAATPAFVRPGGLVNGIAHDGTSLWQLEAGAYPIVLRQLDPATGTTQGTLNLGALGAGGTNTFSTAALSFDGSQLWSITSVPGYGIETVGPVNRSTGAIGATWTSRGPNMFAFHAGRLFMNHSAFVENGLALDPATLQTTPLWIHAHGVGGGMTSRSPTRLAFLTEKRVSAGSGLEYLLVEVDTSAPEALDWIAVGQ